MRRTAPDLVACRILRRLWPLLQSQASRLGLNARNNAMLLIKRKLSMFVLEWINGSNQKSKRSETIMPLLLHSRSLNALPCIRVLSFTSLLHA